MGEISGVEVGDLARAHLPSKAPTPFSERGFDRVMEAVSDYIDVLTGEAYRIARRGRADTISDEHVEEAANHLLTTRARSVFRHLGTVGGILLGTAISQLVTMLSENKFSSVGVVLTATFGILGAFLIALHMAKE